MTRLVRSGSRKAALRLTAILLALLVALLARPDEALAHAGLVRSEPADNAILSEAPTEVRLWFNEPVSAEFSSVQVFDVHGQPVKAGLRRDAADPALLVLTLPTGLADGVYSVNWRVLSEADAHFTQGLMVFGLGEGADVGAAASGQIESSAPLAEVLLRWLNYGLLTALIGALAARFLVLTRMQRDPGVGPHLVTAQGRALRWATWAGVAALAVGLGLLLYQSLALMQTLPKGSSLPAVSGQLLSRSRWGTLWLARQAMLLAFVGVLLLAPSGRRQRLAGSLAALLAVGLLVVQALGSHAAALSSDTALAVAVDALHLLGAGLWLGTLLALAVALLPLVLWQKTGILDLVRAGWGPFGRIAAPRVGLIAATGFYSLGRQVATPDALLTTFYGRALLGKIGLMLAVGAVGMLNSMLLHPGVATPLARLLRRPAGWSPLSLRRLPALVLAESGLGLVLFLVVGLVTSSAPARGPEFTIAANDLLESQSQMADDLVVTFSAKPNKPGQNVYTMRTISQRRPPPAEILRVILHFTYLGQDMGTVTADAEQMEENLYRLGGSYFSLPGLWQVEVDVRRRGIEDSVARFDWTVAPPGEARPVILSNRAWEPLLTVLAAGLLVLVLSATLGGWLGRRPSKKNTTSPGQASESRLKADPRPRPGESGSLAGRWTVVQREPELVALVMSNELDPSKILTSREEK
jgi:copper transport protein